MSTSLTAAQFVLDEIARIRHISVTDRLAEIKADPREAFSMLWSHSGNAPVDCGRAAHHRLEELVDVAFRRHPSLSLDASRKTVRDAVVWVFVDRFVAKKLPLSQRSLDRAIDSAGRHSFSKLKKWTLLIPCHLWSQENPDHFAVGPVRFERAKRALASLDELRTANLPDKLRETCLEFARQSGWVAAVSVDRADADIAWHRSADAVDAAINLLRLFLDPHRTRRCRRADSWGPPATHAHFRLTETGEINTTVYTGGSDEIVWQNWLELLGGDNASVLAFAGSAIDGLIDPQSMRPLQRRFLDALKWFGDGVGEASLAARLTKYVFAWERLVIAAERRTGAENNLTTNVCNRTVHLCEYTIGDRGPDLRGTIAKVYDARSRLAHGSASPWDRSHVEDLAFASEQLTVRALFGALRHYWLLSQGGGSDADLEASFDNS